MYNHTVLERADGILAHCEATLKMYEDWNQYVENEHNHNRSLFLRPVEIKEPNEDTDKKNFRFSHLRQTKVEKNVDPIEVAYEQLNCEMKYGRDILPSVDESNFRRTHTIKFYKQRRNETSPDQTIDANKIRIKGPNETSGVMTSIPNTSSLMGVTDTKKSMNMRKIRMRENTIVNSQMTIKPLFKPVPNDIVIKGYKRNKRDTKQNRSFTLYQMDEIEMKIKKHEKKINHYLKKAQKTCEEITRRIECPIEPDTVRRAPRRRFNDSIN